MSLGKTLKLVLLITVLAAVLLWVFGQIALRGLEQDQPQMFSEPVFDTVAPELPAALINSDSPAILVFSKTNGFRHREAIAAAREMFEQMAQVNGWQVFYTENGAVMTPQNLKRFSVVVWSNATGPALNDQQQAVFQDYLSSGGGFVGIHAAGDASHASWDWYESEVIRAQFAGHPMLPQFQLGTLTKEGEHPAMAHFPQQWQYEDEWYCFAASPRDKVNVLATLDESDINMLALSGRDSLTVGDLAMGDDHPIIWHHTIGSGRVFYSALGHKAEAYQDDNIQTMLEAAVVWAGNL